MSKNAMNKLIPAVLLLAFVMYGCAQNNDQSMQAEKPQQAGQQKNKNVFQGPVEGKSNKAKTISITVGKGDKAKTMMVRFDDNTKGLEYANKGEAAIITWEQRGDDKFATVIEPKLAKLPEGVEEIQVEQMYELFTGDTPFTLVDARPKSRWDQAHLPGAMSIPVSKLKEKKETVLPADKDKLLVFYCGGYT